MMFKFNRCIKVVFDSSLVLSGDDCICGAESAREEAAALAAETEISADEAGIPSFMHRQVFPD